MEGSESEAVFESLKLKPQLFINEVLNCVDDLVDEAFTFFHQEASTILESNGTDRPEDLSKGVGRIRNLIQATLDKRLDMWEKYCLRHCFVVPEGFSLPKADSLAGEELLDLDTFQDSELDAQLDSLRNNLTLVGQEAAVLKREITTLERQSDLVNHSTTSIDEVLQLYEKHSMNEAFQELRSMAIEFRAKVEKLKARKIEDANCGRSVRQRMSNGDIFKTSLAVGLFDAKLEDLQLLLDDMKTA